MRTRVGCLVFAVILGGIIYFLPPLYGYSFSIFRYLAVAFVGVGVLICLGAPVAHDALSIRELLKQIAIWLAIVTLVPLVVWYGSGALQPAPDQHQYEKSTLRLEEKIKETKSPDEKEKLRQEQDRIEHEYREAERIYSGIKFWVGYSFGLAAIVLGIFVPVQVIGSGLMFGGLSALTASCYSYWDRMGDGLKFAALLGALVVVLVVGTWRFRRARADDSGTV